MPHYRDGTEAKLGDVVKGKPYNTPHEVVGVVVGLKKAEDSCGISVAFTTRGNAAWSGYPGSEDLVYPTQRVDYGTVSEFEKLA